MKVEISGSYPSKEAQLFSHKPRELASFWTVLQWLLKKKYVLMWLQQVLVAALGNLSVVSCEHLVAACGISLTRETA